jgi:hypothetical protein
MGETSRLSTSRADQSPPRPTKHSLKSPLKVYSCNKSVNESRKSSIESLLQKHHSGEFKLETVTFRTTPYWFRHKKHFDNTPKQILSKPSEIVVTTKAKMNAEDSKKLKLSKSAVLDKIGD